MANGARNIRIFRNMRIFPRLLILFAILVIISSIAIVFLDYFYVRASDTHAQAVKTSFASQQIATEQQVNLQRMNALLQARFAQIFASDSPRLNGDPSLAASGGLIENDIATREIEFDQSLVSYRQDYSIAHSDNMSVVRSVLQGSEGSGYLVTNQQTALDAVSSKQWTDYKSLQDRVLNALNSPQPDYEKGYALLYQANERFLDLQKNWNIVVTTSTTVGQAVAGLNSSEIIPLQIATLLVIALTLLIILATAFIVNISISRPLRQMAALTERISQGDTSQRAPVDGRDEIQKVAVSMNTMLDNIVALIRDSQRRHISLQTQIETLVRDIQGIGEGDLRVYAEVSSESSLEKLAASFNYVIAELSSIVIKFKTLANEVERASILAYDEMLEVVNATDKQIQHITAANAQVVDMANSSRQMAERAHTLLLMGNEAYATAQNGRTAVARASAGMSRISTHVDAAAMRVKQLEERSQEIDTIVKVISGVANQTNRLALDAAIQAAMAGENGKGFRAVAEDIRRSAEVARAQATMVERIVKQVLEDIHALAISMTDTEGETVTGRNSSLEAGIAFDTIFTAIERQAQEIETINRFTKRQLDVSNQVLHVMQEVSRSSQYSNQSIHTEAERMEGVAQLAERLLASAEVFKLREDQDIFAQTNMSVSVPSLSSGPASYRNAISAPLSPDARIPFIPSGQS